MVSKTPAADRLLKEKKEKKKAVSPAAADPGQKETE
ncbi:hypothetical protein CLV42_13010 [Chitinophaga ginsengisoli]|uniref:Uncharacterized protein n=1 Tax=Chitinophaga ginsengisoli TaxID=363837 RepID=A0A2P8FBE1_9BACT|nr:hypothetical protein CLV42_13010 [Chitinophaga ginsengisoli]